MKPALATCCLLFFSFVSLCADGVFIFDQTASSAPEDLPDAERPYITDEYANCFQRHNGRVEPLADGEQMKRKHRLQSKQNEKIYHKKSFSLTKTKKYFDVPGDFFVKAGTELFFRFKQAKGKAGNAWTSYHVKGVMEVEDGVVFAMDFSQVKNLKDHKYRDFILVVAEEGIDYQGDQDHVPFVFYGTEGYPGRFAAWQNATEYVVEYVPPGEQSRYDPSVNQNSGSSFSASVDSVGYHDFAVIGPLLVSSGQEGLLGISYQQAPFYLWDEETGDYVLVNGDALGGSNEE